MKCKTCGYPYAQKNHCANCGSSLPGGLTVWHILLIIMIILTLAGLWFLYMAKENREQSAALHDHVEQSLQAPQNIVPDGSVQANTEDAATAPANALYTCRECGKSIPWVGSYTWMGNAEEGYNVNKIEDEVLIGDDRVDTPLYSEEGYYSSGIFCSYKCANDNAQAFDFSN